MSFSQASTSGRMIPDVRTTDICFHKQLIFTRREIRANHKTSHTYAPSLRLCQRHQSRQRWAPAWCQQLPVGPQSEPLAGTLEENLEIESKKNEERAKLAAEFGQLNSQIQEVAAEVKSRLQGTSIYLVGMMGSGKSTIGRLLARTLEYPFLDSDGIAEQHTGQSVAEIFEQEGEDAFRELESAVLQELMPFKACVVATGGGVVMRRQNWGYMQHGIVAWLHGPPELLARRACRDDIKSRPLLGNLDASQEAAEGVEDRIAATQQRLNSILDKRREQYAQADLTVSLEDAKGADMGAPVAVVTYRLLNALKDRLTKDQKFAPETPPEREYKGFGKRPA